MLISFDTFVIDVGQLPGAYSATVRSYRHGKVTKERLPCASVGHSRRSTGEPISIFVELMTLHSFEYAVDHVPKVGATFRNQNDSPVFGVGNVQGEPTDQMRFPGSGTSQYWGEGE